MRRYSIDGTSSRSIPCRSSSRRSRSHAAVTVAGVFRYLNVLWDVHTARRYPHPASFPARNTDSSSVCAPSSKPGRIWQWQSVVIDDYLKSICVISVR